MYVKWFRWIMSEFPNYNEHDLVGKQQIHLFSELGLVNCIHIL